MPKSLKVSLLAISVLLIVFVFLGGFLPAHVRAGSEQNAYQQIEVYSEVLQHIQNDYVVTPNIPDVTRGALHGLLEGLDPDSGYLSQSEYQKYQAKQGKEPAQIGVHISKRYGYATIVSVVPAGPADKAGVIDGDVIETIDGQGTRVMPLQLIQSELAGEPGTTVKVSVIEPTSAKPVLLTLTRAVAAYPALHTDEYENSSILYLKPFDMQPQRVDAMLDRIRTAEKSGKQKLLLDLRDVSGGDMPSAVRLANAFLRSGTIATLQGQKFPEQTFTADPKQFVTDAPLMVLVNHGTSGPAEIVAAALKDNNRAQLVGDRTFGSGAVQHEIPMPDGAVLFLSVAKYHAPSGSVIQEAAVVPNVQVSEGGINGMPLPPSTAVTKPGAPASATPAPAPTPDDQLQKALSLLKAQAA